MSESSYTLPPALRNLPVLTQDQLDQLLLEQPGPYSVPGVPFTLTDQQDGTTLLLVPCGGCEDSAEPHEHPVTSVPAGFFATH